MVVWHAVRKHWALVASIAAVLVIGTAFYTLGQTRMFEARGTVMFDPNPPRPLGREVQTVVDMSGTFVDNADYYKTQYWVLDSSRLALAVVNELGLDHNGSFIKNAPPGTKANASVTLDQATLILKSRLTVEPVKGSRLADVSYRDADPARAQRILSVLLDTYVQMNMDDVLESTTTATEWLRTQMGKLKTDLESSELALHEYKQSKNILSLALDDQSNMLREEMQQLNRALTSVRAKREAVMSRKSELDKVDHDDPSRLPASELLNDMSLQQLRSEYVQSIRDRDSLLAQGRGPNHPDTRAAEARVEAIRAAIVVSIRNIQDSVDRDLAGLSKEAAGLDKLYKNAESRAFDLNLLEIEYGRLKRTKDNNEKLFELLMERTKEGDLTRAMRVNNLRIAARPILPRMPVSPKVPLNLAIGSLLGVLIGVAAALGKEQLDRSIKSPDDIEHVLKLNFLGLLPQIEDGGSGPAYGGKKSRRHRATILAKGEQAELIPHRHPTSGIAEASRAIRTNILFMAPDNPFRALLVTSAGPSEGKTTVTCCIAIAMAQAGQRVVMVDCDMRRPRIHKIFGKQNDAGVTTQLVDPRPIEELAQETEVPNLWVIPCGPTPPNPAELLHSEAFENLLKQLRDKFDRVVLDSPPIVPVTDGAVLSTKVDGTILVVRAFKTRKDLARRAARSLLDVGGRVIGTVLNAVDLEGRRYGYYEYQYYKGDGYAPLPPTKAELKEAGGAPAGPTH